MTVLGFVVRDWEKTRKRATKAILRQEEEIAKGKKKSLLGGSDSGTQALVIRIIWKAEGEAQEAEMVAGLQVVDESNQGLRLEVAEEDGNAGQKKKMVIAEEGRKSDSDSGCN
ncbi:hypothetical protein GW17_00034758 [Ensete ventricosum]|nr:hypothetical protein GW17_00034758 [Ensete ventricosum]RZR87771.1 hypothetical protein BHM03_00015237 [Ensete ventricosum]